MLPNSVFAVTRSLPKPLRASHTRQALSDIAKVQRCSTYSDIMITFHSERGIDETSVKQHKGGKL